MFISVVVRALIVNIVVVVKRPVAMKTSIAPFQNKPNQGRLKKEKDAHEQSEPNEDHCYDQNVPVGGRPSPIGILRREEENKASRIEP